MDEKLLCALAAADSWSVAYNGDVYDDARKWLHIWYYRTDQAKEYGPFILQAKVVPFCKNLTRKKKLIRPTASS